MQQSTLPFATSSASSSKGKRKAEAIVLSDDSDDAHRSTPAKRRQLAADASSGARVPAVATKDALVPSSGPCTADPLNINPPTFDLAACFNTAEPRVIKKDPDLDLLYFKSFLSSPSELFCYLRAELPFYRVCYKKGPMQIKTPRFTCVWGKDDTLAPDSTYKIKPRALPAVLR